LYIGIRTSIPFKKNVSVDINDFFHHTPIVQSQFNADVHVILKYIDYFVETHQELRDILHTIKKYISMSDNKTVFYIESSVESMRDLTKLHIWMRDYAEQKNLHNYFNIFISKLGDNIFQNILCREMINSDLIYISPDLFMKFYKDSQLSLMTRFLFYLVMNDIGDREYIFSGPDTQCYISALICDDTCSDMKCVSYDILYEFIRYYGADLPSIDIQK
jgi:spore maturation protein CgeB